MTKFQLHGENFDFVVIIKLKNKLMQVQNGFPCELYALILIVFQLPALKILSSSVHLSSWDIKIFAVSISLLILETTWSNDLQRRGPHDSNIIISSDCNFIIVLHIVDLIRSISFN